MALESLQLQQSSGKMMLGPSDTRRDAAREIMEKARALRTDAQESELGFVVYLLEMVIVETAEFLEADDKGASAQ